MKLFGFRNTPKLPKLRVTLPRQTELRQTVAFGMAAVLVVVPMAVLFFKWGEHMASKRIPTESGQIEVVEMVPVAAEETDAEECLSDRELLGIGIYVVSGGLNKSDYTLTMIGDVIRNRVYSSSYPNTYEAVLTQGAQFGALSQTGAVWPMNATDEDKEKAMAIADKVLDGEQLLPRDCVYVSDTAVGEVVAMLEGLYFGR